jgi:pimeloyl-ACP methyl ester carboxylesterase
MRRVSAAARRLLVISLLGSACRSGAPAPEPPHFPKPQDDEAALRLPGYRSELLEAPVFGGQVFVMEAGEPTAPVVVLVHGLGQNGCRDWYPVLPALAAKFHVLAFDLPGFGRSTHANEQYSPENYAEFMHELLGKRIAGPFSLVGHSMGGAISMYYAAKFPQDVQRLMLIDAAGMLHRKAFVTFAAFAGLDGVLGVLSKPVKDIATVAEESTAATIGQSLPTMPDPSIILKNSVLRSTVLGSPMKIAALATILENFAPAIDGVRAPSWILWGSNDPIASPRTGLVLQARLPAAKLTVLEGSGHDPMLSRPASVERFLLDAMATPVSAPSARTPPPFPALPERKGRCQKQDGMRFSGDYAEIEIDGCREIVLRDVRTASLRIRNSYAIVENTRVVARETALVVKGSRVEITASDFVGNVAFEVEGSDLDLAGVELRGQRASVKVGGASTLIFSVSRADSPINRRYLHGVYEFDIGAEL